MPYVVVHENDEYCVYKMGADEQPTGDSLGCHDTEEAAKAQIMAIMDNEEDMSEDMMEEERAIGTPGDVGMLRSLAGKLTGKRETNEMQIVRSKQGPRLAVIFTSNGYRDREDEHVATAALKAYTDACWSDTNWLGSGNQHLYWHDETLEIGEIIYADMVDGFLMEVSRELQTPVAKAVWDYMETEPHGASHGFRVLARDGNTFTRIAKRETSSLPIAAAANVGTLTEVIMADQDKARSSRLDDIFGISGAADILREQGPAGLNQALAKVGIEAKALTDTEVVQADVAKAAGDFGQLVTQLIDAMSELVTTQDALQAQVAAVTDTETETGKALKALTDELAKLKSELSLTPRRAAQSPAMSATAAAEVQKQSPTEYDTFFAGLNIPKGGL